MYFHILVLSLTILLTNSYRHPSPNYTPNIHQIRKSCGKDATICDYVDNYPAHLVHRKTNRPRYVHRLLQQSDQVPYINIGRRIGVADGNAEKGDMPMCRSRKDVMPPVAGMTKDDVWKFIYNNGEFGVVAEYCEDAGEKCELSLPGLQLICVQKYVYKVLTSINEVGYMRNEDFKIPGGCVCQYKRI